MPRPDEVTAIAAIFWHLRRFGSVVMEPHNFFTLTTNLLKSCPPCVNINWGTGSKAAENAQPTMLAVIKDLVAEC